MDCMLYVYTLKASDNAEECTKLGPIIESFWFLINNFPYTCETDSDQGFLYSVSKLTQEYESFK